MANIRMVYMGNFRIAGTPIFVSDMSANPETSPKFYDHIVGLRDQNFGDGDKKGPVDRHSLQAGGKHQIQKKFWRYAPVNHKVTASGPLTEAAARVLLRYAISGRAFDVVCVFFKDGFARLVSDAVISSLSVTARARDVLTFDAEMVGRGTTEVDYPTEELDCEKLLTWDRVEFQLGSMSGINFADFSVNVSNPIIPIYVAGSLNPKDLRIGIQEVTGTVSTYGFISLVSYATQIRFNLGYGDYIVGTVFSSELSKGAANEPFICSIPFTGARDRPVWIRSPS